MSTRSAVRSTVASERPARVLLVAFGVALFCSLLVASAVYWLRPLQSGFESAARNRAILVAAGVIGHTEEPSERDLIAQSLRIEPRLVDLDSDGLVAADAAAALAFDYRVALNDSAALYDIPAAADIAGLGSRARTMPIYLLRNGSRADGVVVPVYGRGMWSTIHGFVGLRSDLVTIAGATFYEYGETPGIGDRIAAPAWLETWAGKTAYAPDGSVVFRIGGAPAAASSGIDSITGATVTVTAVDKFVRYWLGDDGFGPLLARMRAEGF